MPLFYITGVSGTGKSSILQELKKRGCEPYGVDEDIYAKWVHRQTGETIDYPGDNKFEIHQWYQDHKWVMNIDKVAQLRQRADDSQSAIYLCGAGAGDRAAWHYFTKVFALSIDTETLKHRLMHLTTNDFGKTETELQEVLEWHNGYDERQRQRGSIAIDATQPIETIVAQILTQSEPIK